MGKRTQTKQEGTCVYCGGRGPVEAEHVVPKCIFGDKVRQDVNLITVPSCKECNHRYSRLEDKFKIAVSMQPDPEENPVVKELWDGSISRSMKRPRSKGLWNAVLRQSMPAWERLPSGVFVPTMGVKYVDMAVPEMVDKIVRGLYYDQNGKRLPDDYCVRWFGRPRDFLKPQPADHREQMMAAISQNMHVVHPDAFAYGFAPTREDPSTAVWFLFFYKNVSFAAVAAPGRLFDTSGQTGADDHQPASA